MWVTEVMGYLLIALFFPGLHFPDLHITRLAYYLGSLIFPFTSLPSSQN